ncbi:MAG: DUF4417 domain-containing protein [Defluviitaleaceae bacterium]|nr:DUF4417 domain-containing protein [Defluviitaleaceae bacterium]
MVDFEKQPRLDVFKSELVKGVFLSSTYEFPIVKKTDFKPEMAIPFEKASKCNMHDQWVHFFTHDRQFQCVWNNPKQYLEMFKRYDSVITPDYSLYRDLPIAMQIWNTYRNRAIAYWLQNNGVNIVLNVRWGDERTYAFAFEGIEQGGTIAVSTNGCIKNKLDRYFFKKGLAKMVETIKPDTIVNYSYTPDDIFNQYRDAGINVIEIENHSLTVRKKAVS